jgi:hypothetical protein
MAFSNPGGGGGTWSLFTGGRAATYTLEPAFCPAESRPSVEELEGDWTSEARASAFRFSGSDLYFLFT